MEFSVFLADVRPSSGSKKLSLGAAPIFSGYEEAGVHHMEENPTRLCMPSHWTGETYSPEVVKAGSFQRAHALLLIQGRAKVPMGPFDIHSLSILFGSCKTGI